MQNSPEVFKRSQLVVRAGPAARCLLWWLLVELTPVAASSHFIGQGNPFTGPQSPLVWAQHQQRHLSGANQLSSRKQHHQDDQRQAIESLRRLISVPPAHLWSVDLLPALDNLDQESPVAVSNGQLTNYALPEPMSAAAATHQHQQHFEHQPPSKTNLASTAPSVNRQLIAPPAFYELALAPTSPLQYDTSNSNSITNSNTDASSSSSPVDMQLAEAWTHHLRSASGESAQRPSDSFSRPSLMARSLAAQSSADTQEPTRVLEQSAEPQKQATSDGTEPKNSSDESTSSGTDDKVIEPRQRRRIFNRILKKAEWNHLFVELSKVFLKYFLDLALKDIIGKQSGAETTTSRKKLDAQSELTDLLKDFFKTAISNI